MTGMFSLQPKTKQQQINCEPMKTTSLKQIVATGIALAGLAFIQNLRADTEVEFVGGNASQTVLYDRVTNILTGGITQFVVSPTNSTVRSYVGTIASQPGLGTVTIDFSLLGAVGGLQDLVSQQNERTALTNTTITPTVGVSSTTPEAVALSSSPFVEQKTLVVPFVFIKNTNKSPNLITVTNLTQRQAYYLEGSSGTLPSAFFGGAANNDTVYLVARNTAAAVRTEVDANIYFTGNIATWTTNQASFAVLGPPYSTTAIGLPVPDPNGGQSSGGNVRAQLNFITNAIGTVAAQDISTLTPIAYEGVPYSVTNVENGSYPIWSYEHWFYTKVGQAGAPSANQLNVITNLLAAVTNVTFQTTSPVFVGNFVPYSGLQVKRNADGGPITSLLY
jgi:hypothetical protein